MFVMTRPRATMISILLSVFVWAVQAVVGCDSGKFGERCDRNCSLSCALYPGKNVRICEKDTGRCLGGCIPGWHGDHCNLPCSSNCIDNICNKKDGHCSNGCAENYQGDFCEKEIVPDNRCLPGQFGDACDHVCPPQCAVGICERDTGKCHGGCRPGWHGDHCNLTSVDNISKVNHTSNQGNLDQGSIPHKGETSTTLVILITVSFIATVCLLVIVLIVLVMFLQRRKAEAGWRLQNLCRNQQHLENPASDKEGKNLLNGLNNGVKIVTEEDRLDIDA